MASSYYYLQMYLAPLRYPLIERSVYGTDRDLLFQRVLVSEKLIPRVPPIYVDDEAANNQSVSDGDEKKKKRSTHSPETTSIPSFSQWPCPALHWSLPCVCRCCQCRSTDTISVTSPIKVRKAALTNAGEQRRDFSGLAIQSSIRVWESLCMIWLSVGTRYCKDSITHRTCETLGAGEEEEKREDLDNDAEFIGQRFIAQRTYVINVTFYSH